MMSAPTETNDLGQCFGTLTDKAHYQQTDLSQTWRLWQFQVCTQWGFFTVRTNFSSDVALLTENLSFESVSARLPRPTRPRRVSSPTS